MKKYADSLITKIHPGLGVVLVEFEKKLAPYAQFLEGLRRNPGCLNEAEQDLAKTQMGLIDSVLGQLGGINASLIAGSPSELSESPEDHQEGC